MMLALQDHPRICGKHNLARLLTRENLTDEYLKSMPPMIRAQAFGIRSEPGARW